MKKTLEQKIDALADMIQEVVQDDSLPYSEKREMIMSSVGHNDFDEFLSWFEDIDSDHETIG